MPPSEPGGTSAEAISGAAAKKQRSLPPRPPLAQLQGNGCRCARFARLASEWDAQRWLSTPLGTVEVLGRDATAGPRVSASSRFHATLLTAGAAEELLGCFGTADAAADAWDEAARRRGRRVVNSPRGDAEVRAVRRMDDILRALPADGLPPLPIDDAWRLGEFAQVMGAAEGGLGAVWSADGTAVRQADHCSAPGTQLCWSFNPQYPHLRLQPPPRTSRSGGAHVSSGRRVRTARGRCARRARAARAGSGRGRRRAPRRPSRAPPSARAACARSSSRPARLAAPSRSRPCSASSQTAASEPSSEPSSPPRPPPARPPPLRLSARHVRAARAQDGVEAVASARDVACASQGLEPPTRGGSDPGAGQAPGWMRIRTASDDPRPRRLPRLAAPCPGRRLRQRACILSGCWVLTFQPLVAAALRLVEGGRPPPPHPRSEERAPSASQDHLQARRAPTHPA